MSEKVIFYSTHCPRCLILEKKLKAKGVQYEENNDTQAMMKKGLEMAPALEVNGELLDYRKAIEWVNGR